jgi:hypothetical protein
MALSESRGVPDITIALCPAAWSESMFSQVAPRFGPKYFRLGLELDPRQHTEPAAPGPALITHKPTCNHHTPTDPANKRPQQSISVTNDR